ncbi:transcription elongation factor, mitochondrial-like [Glandiceps talaboti]
MFRNILRGRGAVKLLRCKFQGIITRVTSSASGETMATELDNEKAVSSDSISKIQPDIISTYNEKERQTILDRFNKDTESELSKIKHLRMKTALDIVAHRKENGPFQDIRSLIGLTGIREKMLQFICSDIIRQMREKEEPKTHVKTNNKAQYFAMRPDLSEDRLESLQSIVSIDLAFKSISWIHMSRDMQVTDWKHHQIDVGPSRYDPISYIENVSSVVGKMSPADIYLMEYITFRKKNLNLLPAMLHIRTLEGVIYGMLNSQYQHTNEHKVACLGRMTVGRHFDLVVGSNRKSGQQIATNLVNMAAIHRKPRVIIPPHLIKMFLSSSQLEKEGLTNCLLQAVTFYDLAIHHNTDD